MLSPTTLPTGFQGTDHHTLTVPVLATGSQLLTGIGFSALRHWGWTQKPPSLLLLLSSVY